MPCRVVYLDWTNLQLPRSPAALGTASIASEVSDKLRVQFLIVLGVYPQWLCQSVLVSPDDQAGDVTIVSADSSTALRRHAQVGGLYAAVLRLQRSMMGTRVDTEGRVASLSKGAWNDLLTLAEPHIRAGIHASGCPISEVDDCHQEAWLAVLGKIHLVDPDPERGSLACWLRAIAHRTASRFLRRRAHNVRMRTQPLLSSAQLPDPHPVDPAAVLGAGEETTALATSVESLRVNVGEDAYRLVNEYLVDSSPLSSLPLRIDLGAGRFWHLWRKTKRFLRKRLAPPEQ